MVTPCTSPSELGLVLGLQSCRLGCIQYLPVCSLLQAVFDFQSLLWPWPSLSYCAAHTKSCLLVFFSAWILEGSTFSCSLLPTQPLTLGSQEMRSIWCGFSWPSHSIPESIPGCAPQATSAPLLFFGVFLRWSQAAAFLLVSCCLLSQLLPVSVSVTDVRLKHFTLCLSQAANTYVVIDSSSAETQ